MFLGDDEMFFEWRETSRAGSRPCGGPNFSRDQQS